MLLLNSVEIQFICIYDAEIGFKKKKNSFVFQIKVTYYVGWDGSGLQTPCFALCVEQMHVCYLGFGHLFCSRANLRSTQCEAAAAAVI